MFSYEPADTVIHRMDPRGKLVFQLAFAIAAYARTDVPSLLVLTAGVAGVFYLARLSPIALIYRLRYILGLLSLPPFIAVIQLGHPWIDLADGVEPMITGFRVLLILLVGIVYVRTTPIRASQAGIAWFVPGKAGRFLGIGTGLVARLLPQLLADITRIRTSMQLRHATERSVPERIQLLAIVSIESAFRRANRMDEALRVRCLSWNPTQYPLAVTRLDVAPIGAGFVLLVWGLMG